MQRITRYALLLRQILHYTPKGHSDHDSILIALQLSNELLEKINSSTREQESVAKIDQIMRQLDCQVPDE